jgi:hypothetical protein
MPHHPGHQTEAPSAFAPDTELTLDTPFMAGRSFEDAASDEPARTRLAEAPAADVLRDIDRVIKAGGTVTGAWVDEFGAAGYTCALTVRQALAVGLDDDESVLHCAAVALSARSTPHLAAVWRDAQASELASQIYGARFAGLREAFAGEQRAIDAENRKAVAKAMGIEHMTTMIRRRPRGR